MKRLRKISLLLTSGILMLTLLGGTPIKPKKKVQQSALAKNLLYQTEAVALEDSIRWYRTNWKLNKNLLIKKRQLQEARTWK